MENLLPLLNDDGLVHVHDVSYNIYGRRWLDVIQFIPDIAPINDAKTLRNLYPSLSGVNGYDIPNTISSYEGIELFQWIQANIDNAKFMSTSMGPYSTLAKEQTINSSFWINIEDPSKLKLHWK